MADQREPIKPFTRMTAQELAEATKEHDVPPPEGAGEPLSPEEQAEWVNAVRIED